MCAGTVAWDGPAACADGVGDISETLRQLIERQLAQLGDEEQHVLAAGSVAGLEFTATAVAAGLATDITQVEEWCEGVVRRGHFLRSQGLHAQRAAGAENLLAQVLAWLAEAYRRAEDADGGLCVLAEALTRMTTTGGRVYEAEISRLKGELLLQQSLPDAAQAEVCFQQALNVARYQQAKSWELRAAMSLGRLWQRQGKGREARELLTPIYGWFTEGFDTPDLREAKVLLDELA
jgi:predicted ATPase